MSNIEDNTLIHCEGKNFFTFVKYVNNFQNLSYSRIEPIQFANKRHIFKFYKKF